MIFPYTLVDIVKRDLHLEFVMPIELDGQLHGVEAHAGAGTVQRICQATQQAVRRCRG